MESYTIMSFFNFELSINIRLAHMEKGYIIQITNNKTKNSTKIFKTYNKAIKYYKEKVEEIILI